MVPENLFKAKHLARDLSFLWANLNLLHRSYTFLWGTCSGNINMYCFQVVFSGPGTLRPRVPFFEVPKGGAGLALARPLGAVSGMRKARGGGMFFGKGTEAWTYCWMTSGTMKRVIMVENITL